MRKQWTMAMLVLLASTAAMAEPREGKWEYTSTMKMEGGAAMPQAPQLPPGTKLPPGVQLPQFGPKGMTMKHSSCLTKDDLVPKDNNGECNVTKFDRKGDTVTWAATCNTPKGKALGQGTATYTDTTMTSTMTSNIDDKEMGKVRMKQEMTGRYVGPCDK
ncbi:DUF3617 family protein [Solimonas sp. SE-A11]|uniref:DUF3617 domain-containing protein n=1 Tax=Solimonas sp. SE-A11 TaxID=3054954 RepID=UPI00259C9A27|nr:DUF3617 family protein [Solimonas sp. SE-A11]MDM4772004.1 DUF3617 family protein [Solimonas sp. SE-A11]